MEALAFLALGGAGMYLSHKHVSSNQQARGSASSVPGVSRELGNVPSVNTLYDSTHTRDVAHVEHTHAAQMAKAAQQPVEQSRVLGVHAKRLDRPLMTPDAKVRSHLAGVDIPVEQFTHNNMTPFFKGDLKQSLNPVANAPILERMAGASLDGIGWRDRKVETEAFFDTQQDIGNPYGTALSAGAWRERIEAPRVQNNIGPMPQVRVGPGINQGFTSEPSDGYLSQRPFAMPRDTNEIRVASRPKCTFDGRTLPPQLPAQRGILGSVEKNRPDRLVQLPPEYTQPTTGAYLRETQHGRVVDKPQAREATTREYQGGAYVSTGVEQRPDTTCPKTHALPALQPGPVAAQDKGRGATDDKGRSSIQVYTNARDATTAKVYQGNVTSLIKSITAPLLDVVNPNRGACPHIVLNPREDGNLVGPRRTRLYDPDDVARTTLREALTQAESSAVNLKGPVTVHLHDPDDTTRTTLRETLVQEADVMNIHGPHRPRVHDPDDVTRATLRETLTQDEVPSHNLRGPVRVPVHDPDDIMRTTMKQTGLQEQEMLNIAHRVLRGQVYANDEGVRTTHRETLVDASEDVGPVKSTVPQPRVWDPEHIARATMKQTLVDDERGMGNADALQRSAGAYLTTPYTAPHTQKEVLSDAAYIGQGMRNFGGGHETAPVDLRDTTKAVLADNDYYGAAGPEAVQRPMSMDNYERATLNAIRELVLEGREPTTTSVKIAGGAEMVGDAHVKRQALPGASYEDRREVGVRMVAPPDQEAVQVTHHRQYYGQDAEDRFQDAIEANMAQRAQNPLSIHFS